MPEQPLWKRIAETLEAEIGGGTHAAGDRLPTEAALAGRFAVNRHTVRRALADLASRGLIVTRRGSGAFVAASPADYPIGRRTRFHQNIVAAGRTPAREFLTLQTRGAEPAESDALGIAAEAPVHHCEGLSFADGQPVALFASVFPAARLPGLLERLRTVGSVTQALACEGVEDYTRASTRLTAQLASAAQASLLRLPPGAALLHSESVNVDAAGQPVEFGRTWFAGDRVTLTLAPD